MTSNLSQQQNKLPKPVKSVKKVPSQLIKDQESGRSIIEQFPKPKIIQFLNIGDNSIHTDSQVHVDEPLFSPEPHVIQFTNYEPLQTMEQILKLRNKDKVARSIRIVPPDSKLFSVTPARMNKSKVGMGGSMSASMGGTKGQSGSEEIDQMSTKVAPGMEISYIVKFAPEAKSDYAFDLMVLTEREKFIVPIRAIGCRAMLEFPDALDFGLVPVKFETEKAVMIRNIGEKTTKWHIKTPPGFKINHSEGILEVGKTDQLTFAFVPQQARKFAEEMVLTYDNMEAVIPVIGEAKNDHVYLSKTHIHAQPTSITLFSHQYFNICNKSEVPIEFSWRAFATEMEENEKKQRLTAQLHQEENEERVDIEGGHQQQEEDEDEDGSLDSDDSYDEAELIAKAERKKERALVTLGRKYSSIKKAVDEDKMLFQDEIFSIEPLEGKIWPNTEMTFCMTFRPQGPYHYSCTAFCNTTCVADRLALNLTGQGKGPQATLSITEMDIGDIFVTNERKQEFIIENTGEIDCHWKLIPFDTPFGSKFSFSKTEGTLGVKTNQKDSIVVRFQSDILGEFSETFRFALEGSSEMLTLTFKGHVVAPTFRFSEDVIDFGEVSYKFPVQKTLYLTNTSEVNINYCVRVPGDGRNLKHEFSIMNERGMLEKNKEAEITIEFVPSVAQVYDNVLVVDLEGVGQDMLAVPIRATCLVPKVRVEPNDFLDYGTCFLRHSKNNEIKIINSDSLKAKFEIVPQDEQSKRIGTYEADIMSGVIEPHSTCTVTLKLRTEILQAIRISVFIKLEGHAMPVLLNVMAESIGPIVKVDKADIDYGNVSVLRDYTERVSIKNESKIEAEYTAFTKLKESVWKVVQRHGILKPDETKVIEVVCNADEVQKFQDTLHVIINNGEDKEVNLRAKGIGHTLSCKALEDQGGVDFGTEYTHKNVPKQFFLENRGRKTMQISWVRQTKTDRKKKNPKEEAALAKTNQSGGLGASEKEEEVQFVYTVVPEKVTLNPKMGIMIEFRANSFKTGKISEIWQCQVMTGAERKPKPVWTLNVFGNFITPTLMFNGMEKQREKGGSVPTKLDFKYVWEKNIPANPITKDLVIKNNGPLATSIMLKIDQPFSCPIDKLSLEKAQEETIKIDFDPSIQQNRCSDHLNGKLLISHGGHPHKDTVLLQGEVCFPNLQIMPPNIDFGCILNDTGKKKYLTLTNISEMPVAYEWSFLEEAPLLNEQDEIDQANDKKKKKKKKKQKVLPINEVFDILPVSGILQPHETENVEFTFYAGNGLKYQGMAVCSVEGGPDYDVPIGGESSFVSYKLSTNELDFGEIAYNESISKDFYIENIGKVPFEFNINFGPVSRPGIIECSTMTGKVVEGERFKVSVKFFPGIPDNIREMFLVECAHFPAERFTVKAVGIYPGCLLSFPRADQDEFEDHYSSVQEDISGSKISYTALFKATDAIKAMPPVSKKKDDSVILKEPDVMEVEAECDRQVLCQQIVSRIREQLENQVGEQPSVSQGHLDSIALSTEERKKPRALKGEAANSARQNKSSGFTEMGSSHYGGGGIKFGGMTINLDNINISNYVCDFGNVVVGNSQKKSFRLTNVGKIPVTFAFDKKLLNNAQISIEPDKVQKLNANHSVMFNVTFSTRQKNVYGRKRFPIPIDVKNGPTYTIDFLANMTIPELSMSTELLDFGKVCVNTRKTVKIRLENNKEVDCEWKFMQKSGEAGEITGLEQPGQKQEVERFQVWPQSGMLAPGQRTTVDVMFTPNADKPFTQKLAFKCADNAKHFILNTKGQGINYAVEFNQDIIQLDPVLPYDTSAIACFEMTNNMENPIEIYSLDFDRQYPEEEDILHRMDNFQPGGANEPIFLPLRKPGGEFWPQIRKQDQKKRAIEEVRGDLKAVEDKLAELETELSNTKKYHRMMKEREELGSAKNEEVASQKEAADDLKSSKNSVKDKEEEELPEEPTRTEEEIKEEIAQKQESAEGQTTKLNELLQDQMEVKLPPPVKPENKVNVFMIGPEACGKTTAANYMAQEHQRCVIRLDQLVDFWQKRGHPLYDEAADVLQKQAEKLEELKEEEAKKKPKGRAPKKGEAPPPELKEEEFKYLPKELLKRMLTKRLEEEDCNAGVIYDNLNSEFWADEKAAIDLICETCPNQNIQMVLFNHHTEALEVSEDQEESAEKGEQVDVCVNYRYARRHDPNFIKDRQAVEAAEKERAAALAAAPKKGKGKAAPQKKGGRAGRADNKKDPAQELAEKKAAEEAEEERKRKELEHEKKQDLLRAREQYKPKDYTPDEKAAFAKYAEEISQYFGEIVMRQKVGGMPEKEGDEEGKSQAAGTDVNESVMETSKQVEEAINYGGRSVRDMGIHYDFTFLCEKICHIVPEPVWPDPDKEPLPPPIINSIIKKLPTRQERQQITSYSIWTPSEAPQAAQVDGEEADAQANAEAVEDGEEQKEKLPPMTEKQTRWVLDPKETKKLYVKFFSTKVGSFNQILEFEIVGSYRPFKLNLQGTCEFPTVSQNPRNVFLQQKRLRPPTAPESYLQKCYINSEGCFDFGPLLIKKDPEKRADETVQKVNGTFFQITNNGKYKLDAQFILKSSLPVEERLAGDEGIVPDKSPFIMEPQEMSLAVGETKNLNVYAFPQDAQLYSDQIIALIKDNPNPSIFNVQCLGAKPVVTVSSEKIEFERALLERTNEKVLKLTNTCAIPVNWKLSGCEKLPEEFEVSVQSGTLKPCQEVEVNIIFKAIAEKKFTETITLEVEDVEEYGIKQDNKPIVLEAEAFKISLNEELKINQELDFKAVRVGEPKTMTIPLKNMGMYPIKYFFNMSKDSTKENFTIEPMEEKIDPGQERSIKVRFMSKKELKLKNMADIKLNILEGDLNVEFQTIPIMVSVNAVFSKYTISPLRNINFGPMQFGEQQTRTFEIRNEGLFEFKYNICDILDEEGKQKIREERQKELEERLGIEQEDEAAAAAGKGGKPAAKKEAAKAPPKKGAKEVVPDGSVCKVSQYEIQPAIGAIAPGSASIVNVVFNAQGDQLYDNTLAIDIASRDPVDAPEGIPFQLCAESSHPGINTKDVDQIFEEQTVIPSLDPSLNTQTVISSSLFSIQENVFWFGTLVASKNPEGAKERFKIMNPNKIPCTVKFEVKPRSQSKSEGFAFAVEPAGLTIDPHKHKYVTVTFSPTAMMQYGGILEAIVENGDPESKMGKFVFEIRGEGTLPTLQVDKPTEQDADGTPILRFRKTRIGKDTIVPIVLKNEGQVPATVRFDGITNDAFQFEGNMSHTITQKSYHGFDVRYIPKVAQQDKFILTFSTLNNTYEQHKVILMGTGYEESVTFEGLPDEQEDEIDIGDCIIGKTKALSFNLANNGDKTVKFRWNQGDKDEFRFYPQVGQLKAHSQKRIKIMVKATESKKYEKIDLDCEIVSVDQASDYVDWDDTMKTLRMVRPTELKKILRQREADEIRRKEEAEAAALLAAGKKATKPPAKDKKGVVEEEEIVVDESEEATEELVEVIPEPEHTVVEGSEKVIKLKASCVMDYASFECTTKEIGFKPTLMYASRTFKFTLKNTSMINLEYNWKIANIKTAILDAGPFSINPKQGVIAPGCDDNFIVKYSPTEVDSDNVRLLSANIRNLNPSEETEKLFIEVSGIAERPVIHFELPSTDYRERKQKDMTPIDAKYKIIEFESLGTNIRNTKRFMAVNPTASGYEFEWEEIHEGGKALKPLFKCQSIKGTILSGKKSEMVFEYTPDTVGEHKSHWLFKIPSERIYQHFLVVGRVIEPNVLFDSGKIRFGPLLLQGKNKETVKIINQEEIPFAFNFVRDSIRGTGDYGDSLKVSPMSGTVPAQSELPIEVQFQPKLELTYNYNLVCNVKRKARPLVMNVKGEGYKIHHKIFCGEPRQEVMQGAQGTTVTSPLDFGEFFINEKKVRKVLLQNNGEFNFDFVWRRKLNKYVTIEPDTGTVQKGSEIEICLSYAPTDEHQLKNFKCSLNIVSGPKYDFNLMGTARKPGVKLNQYTFDFGQCFVTGQPSALTQELIMENMDDQALSIESDFQRTNYLDFPLTPGQVLMPDKKDNILKVPILFTPREIRKYEESITLDFNGLYQVKVLIKAQGIPLNLDLRDPDQASTDLGIVSVGGQASKTVPIVNRSQKVVKFTIKPRDEGAFNKNSLSMNVGFNEVKTLKPKEVLNAVVKFNPRTRLPPFSQELMLNVQGVEEDRALFSVTGVAHGIELKLMENTLGFGSVVTGSRLTKTMQMSNFGDVKANFSWDQKAFGKNFTINPQTGFVNPNANLDIEVTFHPNESFPPPKEGDTQPQSTALQTKVTGEVVGGDPMHLNLVGKAVAQESSETQELKFTTIVRKPNTQTVSIQNTDDKEWAINPTISEMSAASAGFFSGKSTLVVPARGSANFEVTYHPKSMTQKQKKADSEEMEDVPHTGNLFFPLPNGKALLYSLIGVSTEPECEDSINETVQARKPTNIVIPVRNWARTTQRFEAENKVDGEEDPSLFIRGANMFDISGNMSKGYKLNFMAMRAGVYKLITTFKVAATGEYVFYRVNVTVEETSEVETIELVSPIRESVSHGIVMENPTSETVTINQSQFTIGNEYVEVTPEELVLKARESREFKINFRPLMISEQECEFSLKNPILGDFKYKLNLKGIAPTSQRSLAFKCALGQDQMQAFKFTHYLKKATNYTVKVERLDGNGVCDFKAEVATIPAAAADSNKGLDLAVNVRYEPITIGDSRGVLKLQSAEGMEYSCLLFGKSSAPQPQGPISCAPGAKPVGIDFKNPLNEKVEFTVSFDNANFSLASKGLGPLEPGKSVNLQIKYDAKPDLPSTGRMIVATKGLPPWIFYLQGQ